MLGDVRFRHHDQDTHLRANDVIIIDRTTGNISFERDGHQLHVREEIGGENTLTLNAPVTVGQAAVLAKLVALGTDWSPTQDGQDGITSRYRLSGSVMEALSNAAR